MVGLIRRTTPNYELQIPNYDIAGWGTAMTKNFDIVDAVLFAVTGLGNIRGEWTNSTLYDAADRVVDPDDGGVWQCSVTHTSAASGTFAADRAAHPTYWTQIVGSVAFRGQWTTGVVYNVNEFLYFDHQYAVTAQAFTGGASYAADVAAGKIVTLIDLRADLNTATTSATNAAASAAAASGSQSAAATSATIAGNSATAAAASQSAAATSASNAATSATIATTKASEASASAAAALASQNAAAASATAANNSAIDAAASALAAQTWNPANYYNKTETDALLNALDGGDITTGTVNKDRLPSTMNATTFPSVTISGTNSIARSIDTSVLNIFGGTSGFGANVELYGSSHATEANRAYYDANMHSFRNIAGGTPTFTIGGNTAWHAGNDGSGSGLDAGLLEGQNAAFFRNGSNINAGTVADARLPTSMAGKTFTSTISMTGASNGLELGALGVSNTPFIDFHSSGGGTNDWDARIIASGGSGSNGQGTLDVSALNFTHNGTAVVTNNGGTWGINISGTAAGATNSSQLGGVAAANYLQTANLGTAISNIGHNAVGSIALLKRIGAGTFVQGDSSLGSQLEYCNTNNSVSAANPGGTWLCQGRCNGGGGADAITVWKRSS